MKQALYGLMIAGLVSGTALAGGPDMPIGPSFRPFVGVNYSYLKASVVRGGNKVKGFNGLGFEAGLKYGDYLGMVWGWNHYFGKTQASQRDDEGGTATNSKLRPETFYFDLRGYYPVMPQFNLIGSLGAGFLDIGTNVVPASQDIAIEGNQVNLRLGVGADYWFTQNWGVQAMFHWVPSHSPASAEYNHYWTISAGVYYMFS